MHYFTISRATHKMIAHKISTEYLLKFQIKVGLWERCLCVLLIWDKTSKLDVTECNILKYKLWSQPDVSSITYNAKSFIWFFESSEENSKIFWCSLIELKLWSDSEIISSLISLYFETAIQQVDCCKRDSRWYITSSQHRSSQLNHSIGRVNEYPTMHYFGIPGHIQSMIA